MFSENAAATPSLPSYPPQALPPINEDSLPPPPTSPGPPPPAPKSLRSALSKDNGAKPLRHDRIDLVTGEKM